MPRFFAGSLKTYTDSSSKAHQAIPGPTEGASSQNKCPIVNGDSVCFGGRGGRGQVTNHSSSLCIRL